MLVLIVLVLLVLVLLMLVLLVVALLIVALCEHIGKASVQIRRAYQL
jgi:hypothetical protein